jgi:class 3 adenylate cyclase/tetratricopeptide (TPR) repeat protein
VSICPNCGEENPEKFRLCGFCGAPLRPALPPQEVRKLVTILFCDLKGSTNLGERLDSESLREVMSSYFDSMSEAIAAHGGTIEKFIGDAVMAVFGLPRVREDDALRAVRAAAAMQAALVELNGELERRHGVTLANRIGVNTGEVVAGDATAGQRLVTGDPVNVAARLEQAAGDGEALLGDLTYRLVRADVTVEPVEPLELKGKAERVPAFRLLSADRRREERAALPSLRGRDEELAVIAAEFKLAARERWARLVTLLAEPGVGKSRLIAEVEQRFGADATFVTGRCLSYGRGITFWPLVEITRELAGIDEEDTAEAAARKLLGRVAGDESVADRLAAVMGFAERQFAVEETFWATRRLLEITAQEKPLVVCIEDIHKAEQTLLDLLEHVLEAADESAILVICAARASLLEIRPGWAERGKVLPLEPLRGEHSEAVVRDALGGGDLPQPLVARIVEAAEGNPLYVNQIVSMLLEEGTLRRENGRWAVAAESEIRIPPTIQALLAARLDLLAPPERAVAESASVVGHLFPRLAVEELVPDAVKRDVPAHLETLTAKRLIRPDSPDDDESYRFDHILIRDTTYQSLLKRTRATLHEKFVHWAERVNRGRDRSTEYDDILGFHLEQAHRYLVELGPLDDHGRDLGIRGAGKLAAAGRRAFARGDMPAAANLLRRASDLREAGDPERERLLPLVAEALMEIGEFERAQTFLDEAAAGAAGDPRLSANVELTRLFVRHRVSEDLSEWRDDVLAVTARLIPELEAIDAHEELARAWRLLVYVHGVALQYGRQADAGERALVHARAAGDDRLEARLTAGYTIAICEGPTPVPEAITICRGVLERHLPERQAEAITRCSLASLLAMAGRIAEARVEYAAARELLADLGGALQAYASIAAAGVEFLAGNPDDVVHDLRGVYAALGELGERYFRPLVGALLAEALQRCGDMSGAKTLAAEVAEDADASDIEAWAILHGVRASVHSAAGEQAAAVEAAQRAVHLLGDTDAPVAHAQALVRLGEALLAAGRVAEARETMPAARRLYERKGNTAAAGRLREAAAQLA